MNKAFEAVLGTTREDIVGKKASATLPPEELKSWLEVFGRVGRRRAEHYEIYSPTSKKHFHGYAYSPREGEFAVIFEDITERKNAEETMRASEARYRSLVEYADNAILLTDAKERILAANPAACRMARTEEEMCARSLEAIIDTTDARIPETRRRAGPGGQIPRGACLLSRRWKHIPRRGHKRRFPRRRRIAANEHDHSRHQRAQTRRTGSPRKRTTPTRPFRPGAHRHNARARGFRSLCPSEQEVLRDPLPRGGGDSCPALSSTTPTLRTRPRK